MKLRKIALAIITTLLVFFTCGNFNNVYAANETIIRSSTTYFNELYGHLEYDDIENSTNLLSTIISKDSYYQIDYVQVKKTYEYRLTVKIKLKSSSVVIDNETGTITMDPEPVDKKLYVSVKDSAASFTGYDTTGKWTIIENTDTVSCAKVKLKTCLSNNWHYNFDLYIDTFGAYETPKHTYKDWGTFYTYSKEDIDKPINNQSLLDTFAVGGHLASNVSCGIVALHNAILLSKKSSNFYDVKNTIVNNNLLSLGISGRLGTAPEGITKVLTDKKLLDVRMGADTRGEVIQDYFSIDRDYSNTRLNELKNQIETKSEAIAIFLIKKYDGGMHYFAVEMKPKKIKNKTVTKFYTYNLSEEWSTLEKVIGQDYLAAFWLLKPLC